MLKQTARRLIALLISSQPDIETQFVLVPRAGRVKIVQVVTKTCAECGDAGPVHGDLLASAFVCHAVNVKADGDLIGRTRTYVLVHRQTHDERMRLTISARLRGR